MKRKRDIWDYICLTDTPKIEFEKIDISRLNTKD